MPRYYPHAHSSLLFFSTKINIYLVYTALTVRGEKQINRHPVLHADLTVYQLQTHMANIPVLIPSTVVNIAIQCKLIFLIWALFKVPSSFPFYMAENISSRGAQFPHLHSGTTATHASSPALRGGEHPINLVSLPSENSHPAGLFSGTDNFRTRLANGSILTATNELCGPRFHSGLDFTVAPRSIKMNDLIVRRNKRSCVGPLCKSILLPKMFLPAWDTRLCKDSGGICVCHVRGQGTCRRNYHWAM